MSSFGDYSKYYNLLYRDKDYAAEVDYVDAMIRRWNPGTKTLIEFGCGTGRHAALFAQKGYHVDGVDSSEQMLAEARRTVPGIDFHCGDIRVVDLAKKADGLISLFHVISYQIDNEDLKRTFSTAFAHLEMGGLFLFDCWYGPGVLSDLPEVRVKRVETENVVLTRIAEPLLRPNDNLVEVKYRIILHDRKLGRFHEIEELHIMRYLFLPEIKMLLQDAGFILVEAKKWLTQEEPSLSSWYVCCVARKSS